MQGVLPADAAQQQQQQQQQQELMHRLQSSLTREQVRPSCTQRHATVPSPEPKYVCTHAHNLDKQHAHGRTCNPSCAPRRRHASTRCTAAACPPHAHACVRLLMGDQVVEEVDFGG